jgi:endonuclease/exonuclease/phosphatase family metal-dependent hydrolase
MEIRALTWNLYHGRDFPPDPALFTRRSRLLGIREPNATHLQTNRDLFGEFAGVLDAAPWDVALLQECPPRWSNRLARACGAIAHRSLTSRNQLMLMRRALARRNPDLLGSWEGGSNLTLVRGALAESGIAERHDLVLRRLPERRTMALTRMGATGSLPAGPCVANLHASTTRPLAEEEIRNAAEAAVEWAGDAPLLLGGDLNVRPRETGLYQELAERFDLQGPTAPDAIDHLLARGLDVVEQPRAWPPEAREVSEDGLAIRLSDHAPVEALFSLA